MFYTHTSFIRNTDRKVCSFASVNILHDIQHLKGDWVTWHISFNITFKNALCIIFYIQ